jgi:hypothetical protein
MNVRWRAILLASAGFGACISPSFATNGEQTVVYRFSTTTVLIPVVVSLVLVAVGWLSPRMGIPGRYRWRLVALGVFAGILFAPMMYLDRVVVSPTGIVQRTGFWFMPTVKGFAYDDVRFVRVTTERVGPKRRLETIWQVHYLDGSTEDIDPGDLWANNSDTIIPLLQDRGVVFHR